MQTNRRETMAVQATSNGGEKAMRASPYSGPSPTKETEGTGIPQNAKEQEKKEGFREEQA